jgi:tRNA (guanine6-N2)-methyltransferase
VTRARTGGTISLLIEAEITEGLERFAQDDIGRQFGQAVRFVAAGRGAGRLRFQYSGPREVLLRLQCVESLFSVESYDVPRPKALLGDANMRRLAAQVDAVQRASREPMRTLYLSAAGADSAVMRRIRDTLCAQVNLQPAETGDVQVRIAPGIEGGWETRVRLTARPLSARAWRVCNYGAALNATVAYAMARLARPDPRGAFVNLCAGSASILIEAGIARLARLRVGIELEDQPLRCGIDNLQAAAAGGVLMQGDVRQLPFAASSIDALSADLPFGQHSGSPAEIAALYPAVLAEAARVARPGARFTILSHAVRALDAALQAQSPWVARESYMITLRGLHPRLLVLERS